MSASDVYCFGHVSTGVILRLRGLASAFRNGALLTHYRVDTDHSNSFDHWRRMGAPPHPNEAQYEELRAAGQLAELAAPAALPVSRGSAILSFALPRQGVSLLVLTPADATP